MKKSLTIVAITLACCAALTAIAATSNLVITEVLSKNDKTSKELVTKQIDIASFDAINVSNFAKVTLTKGSGPITYTTNENLLEDATIEVSNNTLHIKLEKDIMRGLKNATFEVTIPVKDNIRSIELSGASSLSVDHTLSCERLSLDIDGASRLTGDFDIKGEFAAEVSSASRLDTNTTSANADIECSGASRATATISCKEIYIKTSGASRSKITASAQSAHVECTGASSTTLLGEVKDLSEVESSGASRVSVAELKYNKLGAINVSGASSFKTSND